MERILSFHSGIWISTKSASESVFNLTLSLSTNASNSCQTKLLTTEPTSAILKPVSYCLLTLSLRYKGVMNCRSLRTCGAETWKIQNYGFPYIKGSTMVLTEDPPAFIYGSGLNVCGSAAIGSHLFRLLRLPLIGVRGVSKPTPVHFQIISTVSKSQGWQRAEPGQI